MSEGRYFCPQCGCEIHGAYAFCPFCGATLNQKKIQALFGNADTDTETSKWEEYNDDSETKLLGSMDCGETGDETETVLMQEHRPKQLRNKKKRGFRTESRSAVQKTARARILAILIGIIAAAILTLVFLYMLGMIGAKA